MSALTTRCTDPKILLALCRASTHALCRASTHVANSHFLAYTGELAMTGFCKINGLTPPS